MRKESPTFGLALATLAAVVLIIAWNAWWTGLALSHLWGWFVVDAFDAPELSIARAYGIALMIRLISIRVTKENDSDSFVMRMARYIFTSPMLCGIAMGVGWVAKAWV